MSTQSRAAWLSLFLSVHACASTSSAPPAPPRTEPTAMASASAAPPPGAVPETAPAPAASPEELARVEQAKKLAAERAAAEEAAKTEAARFTPEMRAQAKALAERTYPTLRAAVDAALKSPHRHPGHEARDKYRHPRETLEFFGMKPTSIVLEYGPGEGWFTEILAPTLAAKGKLLVTTTDPNGPPDVRSSLYALRLKLFLDQSPEVYGKVEPVIFDPKEPKLDHEGKVDLVIVLRGLHGMVNDGSLNTWLAQFHAALKPSGTLGIEQHRAKPGAVAQESAKQGYLPEKWVIEQIEAAGFKLNGKSEINANLKDTKDYEQGVWTLPPALRLGDKDREKYVAIGESDRMTLRFTKVAQKK